MRLYFKPILSVFVSYFFKLFSYFIPVLCLLDLFYMCYIPIFFLFCVYFKPILNVFIFYFSLFFVYFFLFYPCFISIL